MYKTNWCLTSDEKLRILSLHENATKNFYLLNEKNGEGPETSIEVIELDKKSFPAGKYNISSLGPGKQDLDNKLVQLAKFIEKYKNSNVVIQIEVGESAVTNYDREKYPFVKGRDDNFTKEKSLPVGKLAELRGQQIREYLKSFLQKEVDRGTLTKMPDIPEPQTNVKLGTQKHTYTVDYKNPQRSDDPRDEKYLEDQYVKFKITVSAEIPQDITKCLVDLVIDVSYTRKCGPHQCDNAEFEVYLNGQLLGVANLNNAGCKKQDCFKYAKFRITQEMVDKLITEKGGKVESLILWTKCISTWCHSSIQEVKIINGKNETIYDACVSPQAVRGDTSKNILAVLDKCGKPVQVEDDLSPEQMYSVADQINNETKEKIDNAIETNGLYYSTSSLAPIFAWPNILENIDFSNVKQVGNYVQFIYTPKKKNESNTWFTNPLYPESKGRYVQTMIKGKSYKINFPVATVKMKPNKLERQLNRSGAFYFKVPNQNLFFTTSPFEINGKNYAGIFMKPI